MKGNGATQASSTVETSLNSTKFYPGLTQSSRLDSVTVTGTKLEFDDSAVNTQGELYALAVAIPIGIGITIIFAGGAFVLYWQGTEKDRQEVLRVIVDWTTDTVGSVTDKIVDGLKRVIGGFAENLRGAIEGVVSHVFQSKKKKESSDGDGRNAANDKLISNDEIERLKEGGVDIHELKGKNNASKRDLYKDAEGNIYVKPKGGRGPGEDTGLNINDF
jgi:Bacterial toxin 33